MKRKPKGLIAGLVLALNVPTAGAVVLGPFPGSWTGTENTQADRIWRDGVPSDGTGSKAYPGNFGAGTQGYQVLETFLNDGGEGVVTINAILPFSFSTHMLAYLTPYDPTNLPNNYLGDSGVSSSTAFSILAPAGSQFSVVVQTVFGLPTAVGDTFSYTISGSNIGFKPTALTHLPVILAKKDIGRSVMLRDRLDSFADGSTFQNNLSGVSSGNPTGSASGFWKDGNNGMFINASHTDYDRDKDGDLYGLNGDATSFTVGFDRKINDRFIAGIALGYDDIDSSAKSRDRYSGDMEAWGVSVYGRHVLPVKDSQFSWYVDGVLGYSDNDIDTARSANEGDTDADQFSAEVVIGAERLLDSGFEVSPYGGLHYINTDIDGYTESGPSALAYEDQDSHVLYAVLGGEVSTEKQTGNGWAIRPEAYAELRSVIDDNNDDLTFAFATPPGSRFQQEVQPYDDYSVTLGLGVEGQRSEDSSFYARISATVGEEGSFDYGFSAGVNLNF